MILALLQDGISVLKDINVIYVFLLMLGAVLVAIILYLSKGKEIAQQTNLERATSSEALIKVRDIRIADLEKQLEKTARELEDITAEHRAVVGINLGELIRWASTREYELAEKARMESENRVLRIRCGEPIGGPLREERQLNG